MSLLKSDFHNGDKDGLAVRIIYCYSREPEFHSQHPIMAYHKLLQRIQCLLPDLVATYLHKTHTQIKTLKNIFRNAVYTIPESPMCD